MSPSPEPTPPLSRELEKKFAAVKLLFLDVDGTLTDNMIYLDGKSERKGFNITDGMGMGLLRMAGVEIAFVTGRHSEATVQRAKEMRLKHVFQGPIDKGSTAEKLAEELEIDREGIASMGDDLPDLSLFRVSNLKLAPANAVPEVAADADWISQHNGGAGALREAAELILKAQGKWDAMVERLRDMSDLRPAKD